MRCRRHTRDQGRETRREADKVTLELEREREREREREGVGSTTRAHVHSLDVGVGEATVVDHKEPIDIHVRSTDGRQAQMQSVNEQTEIDEEELFH